MLNEEVKLRADIAARVFDTLINNRANWSPVNELSYSIECANQIVDDAMEKSAYAYKLKSEGEEVD